MCILGFGFPRTTTTTRPPMHTHAEIVATTTTTSVAPNYRAHLAPTHPQTHTHITRAHVHIGCKRALRNRMVSTAT